MYDHVPSVVWILLDFDLVPSVVLILLDLRPCALSCLDATGFNILAYVTLL